jgi:hypothetical protein
MRGPDPRIHLKNVLGRRDCRVKPGNDTHQVCDNHRINIAALTVLP